MDKFVTCIESLDDVGKPLLRAQQAYDESFSPLFSGRDSLLQQAVAINSMGVSGKKILPQRCTKTPEIPSPGNDDN